MRAAMLVCDMWTWFLAAALGSIQLLKYNIPYIENTPQEIKSIELPKGIVGTSYEKNCSHLSSNMPHNVSRVCKTHLEHMSFPIKELAQVLRYFVTLWLRWEGGERGERRSQRRQKGNLGE